MINSIATGEGRAPNLVLPPHACETHSHIYEPRYETLPHLPIRRLAPVSSYRKMLERLGFERCVIVQSSTHGIDNTGIINAIGLIGMDRARGVATIPLSISNAELIELHSHGIRGIRISSNSDFTLSDAPRMARKIADRGWHLQLARWTPEVADLAKDFPVDLVVDHLGRTSPEANTRDAAFISMLKVYEKGRCWIKISAPYYSSNDGPPRYSDFGKRVQALASIRTDRLLWGANWPHPRLPRHGEPEEADWLDAMKAWIPSEADRNAVFVTNPCHLYQF